MLDGSMFCGVIKDDLVVRVGPARYEEALGKPHARPMDFTGRPMTGFVYVSAAGRKSDASLEKWVRWGAEFVSTLPAKKSPKRASRAARPRR